MAADPMPTFSVRIFAPGGDRDAAVVEEFALALRAELDGLDLLRVQRAAAGPGPDGSRAAELLDVFEYLITTVETGEAVAKVVAAVRRLAGRLGARASRLAVAVDGVELDLGQARSVVAGRTGTRSALIVANASYDDPVLAGLRGAGADAAAL